MSNKFQIDSSKFIFNDEYIENDLDVLENVSIPITIQEENITNPNDVNIINDTTNDNNDNNNSNPQQ
jgi:ABC-type lipoprotein export system ATPase subunit